MSFSELVASIPDIGVQWHQNTLIENTRQNFPAEMQLEITDHGDELTIKNIPTETRKCLIVSAGPSLYRQKSLDKLKGYTGTIVATDGAYVQCLRHGILPDYILTIDPHPTRIVRWFGDPEIEAHQADDDYFERQDLDVSFRENSNKVNAENYKLVEKYSSKLVIACSAPANIVERTKNMDRYWFTPLVDDPETADVLTKQMVDITGLPAMNTGGTVGNACWVFSHSILKSKDIACVGMDFGYYHDTPYEQTQNWNMLKDFENPQDYFSNEMGACGNFYTDPTYYWYRQNLRDLMKAGKGHITNCTEGGLLHGFRVNNMSLKEWLKS